MKKGVIVFLMLLLVMFVAITITIAVTSNRESDATIERIDRKIEMYEAGRR